MKSYKQNKRVGVTYEVLDEALTSTAVYEGGTPSVYVSQVHGRTLHAWVREPHLKVDVVHVLKEVTKRATCRSDGFVIPVNCLTM